jgi:small subunit ribosomal protein S17e
MGRMKSRHLRTLAKQLIERFPQDFGTDFNKNKEKIMAMHLADYSKEARNKIAGEVTAILEHQAKREAEETGAVATAA